MIKSWRELKAKLFGPKVDEQTEQLNDRISNPYIGLTMAELIERRRALMPLYVPQPIQVRRPVRPLHETDQDIFPTLGLGGAPSVPFSEGAHDPSPSFEPGGGEMGGGGASESYSSDPTASDYGGGSCGDSSCDLCGGSDAGGES